MNNLNSLSVLGSMGPYVYILALVDLALKGICLYKSAQKNQKIWFVALLLVNSMGILPIIYLIINKELQFGKTVAVSKAKVAKTSKKRK